MKTQLTALKTYLLTKYDFFDKGYANVGKPNQSDIILDEDQQQYAGITDTDGNYFYLRATGSQSYDPVKRGARIAYYHVTTQCRAVAVHSVANTDELIQALVEAISAKGHIVRKSEFDKTKVFREETGQNLKYNDLTLIYVDFEVNELVSAKNCTLNPCNC